MSLVKKGICLRCGKCCQVAHRFKYDGSDWQFKEYEKDEPVKPCTGLAFDPETDLAVCVQQDNKRPCCALFPTVPEEIVIPGCGFYFEEIEGITP